MSFQVEWGPENINGENNGWIYRWDVQHNVADLINLMGGKETFIKTLMPCFHNL